MAITPIPSSRVSDSLARQRLLNQLAADQRELVRLQTQVSTGQRLILPSDDAPAALRAMSLQQLIERKQQVRTNLTTNQSYLDATDSALSRISSLLADARGTAVAVADSTASNTQRAAAAQEISGLIRQLVDTGNQKFRGRYLFAGTASSAEPFSSNGKQVLYSGNAGQLQSYGDLGVLFDTNANGDTMFGAISKAIEGSVDLDPVLKADTRLADLRGGQGISDGSIAISDGTLTSFVDISGAETIGDVADLLRSHPPTGRNVAVTVTRTGLTIELDSAGGGALSITEVGGGTTATELGILEETGAPGTPIVGNDLDPRLNLTTPLTRVLGVGSQGLLTSTGSENDIVFEALPHGTALDGVTIELVDNVGVVAGSETVLYDDSNPLNRKLIFQIDAGNTSANNLVAALNGDPVASQLFRAALSASDGPLGRNRGTGKVDVTATVVTSGGQGADLDKTSGIRITSGTNTFAITFGTAETIEDVLNRINGSGAGVLAELNAERNGINVRSRISGVDFSIGENGGATAAQLGLRTFTESTRLEDLNHGLGVHQTDGTDFIVRRKDGTQLAIDLSGAQTIGDVLALINTHPSNLNPVTKVTARLAAVGNGIELVTTDTATTASLAVLRVGTNQSAADLGLIVPGEVQSAPATVSGGTETITGRDSNPSEVHGIFNSLARLQQALETSDTLGIERALAELDKSNVNLNLSRAELGARQQGLDILGERLDDEALTLKDHLSREIETDLPEAISNLTARQAALEASLRLTAAMSRLTLLEFL